MLQPVFCTKENVRVHLDWFSPPPHSFIAPLLCSGEMLTFAFSHLYKSDESRMLGSQDFNNVTDSSIEGVTVSVNPLQGLAHHPQANRPVQGALSHQPIIGLVPVRCIEHQYRQPGRYTGSTESSSRSTY